LRLRRQGPGKLEEDIPRKYADDVVLLHRLRVFRGHERMRRSVGILYEQFSCGRYQDRTKRVEGKMAFLEWVARCPAAKAEDGADSFLVRNGRIAVQTIHYIVCRLEQPGKP